jgi:DNA invertase Pin-like site-specific DNA recombinase
MVPAAQYVRMSTEHQQYSIENQQAVIAEYAEQHGFTVVRTYADAARSGLDLAHRPGLQQMLADVVSSQPDYEAILVYDVSRWGRFQDTDESAHYEFLCKQSGIRVHYCAEPFSNDDSLFSSLCKALKRSMAGEFSRELGVKVFAGQRRLTELGYKMGGPPGYGLRRVLLSADGTPERELGSGERKYLSTQHVVFAPGPEHEIVVVRRIFGMYLEQDFALREIAGVLNAEGVPRHDGMPWGTHNIRKILIDPKYAGCAVFGRSTKKLHTRARAIPKEHWVVRPNSFAPVVSLELLHRAQRKLSSRYFSDAELLDSLRAYMQKHGTIAKSRMRPGNGLPSDQTITARFGSVVNAYKLAGIELSEACMWGHAAVHSSSIRNCVLREFREAVTSSGYPFRLCHKLHLLEGVQPFLVATAKRMKGRGGHWLWRLCGQRGMQKQHCVIARFRPDYTGVQDWCLIEYVSGRRRGRRSFTDQEVEATNTLRDSAVELVPLLVERLRLR